MRRSLACLLAVALFAGAAAAAVFEPRDFATAADEARYKAMLGELRCPKCQNQNIADSDAPLAKDLRREVYRMVADGRSDAEIVDYMVARYGDFVRYRPPFKAVTAALWLGPALLAAAGFAVLWRALRRRGRVAPATLSREERARLDALLGRHDG